MKCRVYKSLDKTSEFFGIKSRFLIVFLLMSCVSCFASIFVGSIFSLFVGIGALIIFEIAAFCCTAYIQSKISEKKLYKLFALISLPDVYYIRPKHIRTIWRGFSLEQIKTKE